MSTNLPSTPPDGWNAFQGRKQQSEQSPPSHNQPESSGLTPDEERIFDNARNAINDLHGHSAKTYEAWVLLGCGVECASNRADRVGGKRAFMRVLEQQRLYYALGTKDGSVRSQASRLLKMVSNRAEIEAWRAKLSDHERLEWSSPSAIEKHFFQPREREAKRRDGVEEQQEKPPSPAQRIKTLEADLAHAQDELASTIARYESGTPLQPEPMFRDDGEPVKPRKVSKGFAGVLSAWKAIREALIREALQDEQPLTLGQLDELWEVITHDRDELISLFPQAPAPKARRSRRKPAKATEAAVAPEAAEGSGSSGDSRYRTPGRARGGTGARGAGGGTGSNISLG